VGIILIVCLSLVVQEKRRYGFYRLKGIFAISLSISQDALSFAGKRADRVEWILQRNSSAISMAFVLL
jgi:hypothetical protein